MSQEFTTYPHAFDLNAKALWHEEHRADPDEFYTETARLLAEAAKTGTPFEVEPPVSQDPYEAWAVAGAGATVMRVRGTL